MSPFGMFPIMALFSLPSASGHGNMVLPFTWFDHWHIGASPGQQCWPGCEINAELLGGIGCACFWYTNNTIIPGETTIFDPALRTYDIDASGPWDWTASNPWRAPGSALVDSPCGVAGGNPDGCGTDCQEGGYAFGPAAENFHFTDVPVTEWSVGGVVEAAWAFTANHGGGYSYRLCPAAKLLTEECFQATPLAFVGDQSWIEYGIGRRIAIPATRTSKGTVPDGSTWTKNPIPPCEGTDGGFFQPDAHCEAVGTQFPAPGEGMAGYGSNVFQNVEPFKFHIVDKLQVPTDIAPGDYVLSFRWDSEQTPQVWNSCADVKLVGKS